MLAIFFLLSLSFPICSLRWYLLLHTQKIFIPYVQLFKVNYFSTFFGLFLPGLIGGDAIRIALGTRLVSEKKMVFALSVFVDRLIGAIGLFSLSLIALLLFLRRSMAYDEIKIFIVSIIGIAIIVVILFGVAGKFVNRIREVTRGHQWQHGAFLKRLISNLVESAFFYRNSLGQLVLCYGLSVIVHVSRLMVVFILAVSMEMGGIDVLTYVLAGTVSFLANFLPFTPGGLGIGEAAFSHTVGALAMADKQMAYGTVILAFRAFDAVLLFPAILVKLKQGSFLSEKTELKVK